MWRGSIFASALCALLLDAPIPACLAPAARLSAEEMECCKEMAEGCGTSADMSASHSCCSIVVRPQNDILPSASVSLSAPFWHSPTFEIPLLGPHADRLDRFGICLARAHAPPGLTLELSSLLRI